MGLHDYHMLQRSIQEGPNPFLPSKSELREAYPSYGLRAREGVDPDRHDDGSGGAYVTQHLLLREEESDRDAEERRRCSHSILDQQESDGPSNHPLHLVLDDDNDEESGGGGCSTRGVTGYPHSHGSSVVVLPTAPELPLSAEGGYTRQQQSKDDHGSSHPAAGPPPSSSSTTAHVVALGSLLASSTGREVQQQVVVDEEEVGSPTVVVAPTSPPNTTGAAPVLSLASLLAHREGSCSSSGGAGKTGAPRGSSPHPKRVKVADDRTKNEEGNEESKSGNHSTGQQQQTAQRMALKSFFTNSIITPAASTVTAAPPSPSSGNPHHAVGGPLTTPTFDSQPYRFTAAPTTPTSTAPMDGGSGSSVAAVDPTSSMNPANANTATSVNFSDLCSNYSPTPGPFSEGSPTLRMPGPASPRRMHRRTKISLPITPPQISFAAFRMRCVEDLYETQRKLSEGTYGEVYVGRDLRTGATVALKRLKRLSGLDGFPLNSLREVTALRHIQAQQLLLNQRGATEALSSILTLRDVLLSSSTHDIYLVFEYISHSLAGLLSLKGAVRFSSLELTYIFTRVMTAVAQLHCMDILHRDIKADNILLSSDGRVLLADFGLCVFKSSSSGSRHGGGEAAAAAAARHLTPSMIHLQYRPPEMLLGEPYGPKVDVWSVGCLIAQVYLGHPPFSPLHTRGGAAPPAGSRGVETELQQLSCICDILGPLGLSPDWFDADQQGGDQQAGSSRHRSLLKALSLQFQSSGGAPLEPSSSLYSFRHLMRPSSTFQQFKGFRAWFTHHVEQRHQRYAREALRDASVILPPQPTTACVDVLTRIFTLSPRERPSSSQVLRMPYFEYVDLKLPTNSPSEKEAVVMAEVVKRLATVPESHIAGRGAAAAPGGDGAAAAKG